VTEPAKRVRVRTERANAAYPVEPLFRPVRSRADVFAQLSRPATEFIYIDNPHFHPPWKTFVFHHRSAGRAAR
jgi:hypothetical protein